MDFGDILDEWERLSARPGGLDEATEAERRAVEADGRALAEKARAENKAVAGSDRSVRRAMETWLDRHGVEDKDARSNAGTTGIGEAKRIASLKPGARLDLHGMTVAEAHRALDLFLEDAARRGIEKVLVITGKGNHSASGGVLSKAVRGFLESNPRAGTFGHAARAEGGTGALWIVVRRFISPDR